MIKTTAEGASAVVQDMKKYRILQAAVGSMAQGMQ